MVPPPPREYCGFSRRLVGLKEISPVERRAYVDCEGTNLYAWLGLVRVMCVWGHEYFTIGITYAAGACVEVGAPS